jgi:hypothetical protein
MAINWETGEIDDEQHRLHPEQTVPAAYELEPGDIAYIDGDLLGADISDHLWLPPTTPAYNYVEAKDMEGYVDMVRVICVEEGLIADVSTGKFFLDDDSGRIPTHPNIEYADEWLPVIGLVETDDQRKMIAKILFEKHDVVLGQPALEEDGEQNPAVEPGDGDDGAAA